MSQILASLWFTHLIVSAAGSQFSRPEEEYEPRYFHSQHYSQTGSADTGGY